MKESGLVKLFASSTTESMVLEFASFEYLTHTDLTCNALPHNVLTSPLVQTFLIQIQRHPFDGRVVSNFIRQALNDVDITIYGTGDQSRSFQFVSDLIDGFWRMMHNSNNFVGPVNLGNPHEFTVKELASMVGVFLCTIASSTSLPPQVLEMIPHSKSKITYLPCPKDDPTQRKPVIEVAQRELDGWEPKVQLRDVSSHSCIP